MGNAMTRLRQLLLALMTVGAAATALDLFLVEHYGDWWQLAPFGILALGVAGAAWLGWAPTPLAVCSFRLTMGLFIAGGALGLWLHYVANVEFEREFSPEAAGLTLFWNAIKGAAPPTLAPAALIHLGLLGLASTYGTRFYEGEKR